MSRCRVRNLANGSRAWLIFAFAGALLATSCAKRYQLQGMVLAVRPAERVMVVSHKAIPGVMPAMAMPLRVANPADLAHLVPGTSIDFQLSHSTARRIRIRKPANEIEQDGRKVVLEPPRETVAVGQPMPDWTLVDHHNRPIRLSGLRGKVIAIQFLYTRCPMPEICPRLAATFSRLQRRFPDRMSRDLILMSITLDPTFDTPDVLSRYATLWRPQPGWYFLTGTEADIRFVANRFGLIYWPEEGVITHNSTVGLIDREGKVAAVVEGLSFDAQQLGDLIAAELEKQ